MSDVLAEICARKREHIAARRRQMPEATLRRRLDNAPPPRGFAEALAGRIAAGGYGLIAEIKKASPSKGLIRADFDPPSLASRERGRGGRFHCRKDPVRRDRAPCGSNHRQLDPF